MTKLSPPTKKKRKNLIFHEFEVVQCSDFPGGPLAKTTLPIEGTGVLAKAESQMSVSVLYLGASGKQHPSISPFLCPKCPRLTLEPWPASHQDRVVSMGPFSFPFNKYFKLI